TAKPQGAKLQLRGQVLASAAAGDLDVERLAEAGKIADLIEQIALGLGERLERHGPAAATEQRLQQIQRQRRGADRVFGAAGQLHRRLVGDLETQSRTRGEQLGEAYRRAMDP